MDKSRSAISRTHTTSSAPAPALAPATIAFSAISTVIIDDILHSEGGSPNNLLYLNARDETSLRALAKTILPSLIGRHKALDKYISDSEKELINASEKTKRFWAEKKAGTEALLAVFVNADKSQAQLDAAGKKAREEYFLNAKAAWEISLRDVLIKLNNEIIGPYALGMISVNLLPRALDIQLFPRRPVVSCGPASSSVGSSTG